MSFIVLYDTSAMFGNASRDLLIRVAMARLVQAKWTEKILDELDQALIGKYHLSEEKVIKRRERMYAANPDGIVEGYEYLVEGLKLRDPNDRHVLAAAVKCGAQVIVAQDKDFTREDLAPWGIEPKTPDEFLLDQYDLRPGEVYGCVQRIADSRTKSRQTVDEVLDELARSGLIEFAAALRSGAPQQ
jgi:predicted nucleic acid-binding protein